MREALGKALSTNLKDHFSLSVSRRETLSWLILSIMEARTVSAYQLSAIIETPAKQESVQQRFRRFFKDIRFEDGEIAPFVTDFHGLGRHPWVLCLDRTNWKLGKRDINLLVLSMTCGDISLPLFWRDLDKAGNSNTEERLDLIGRFKEVFPDQKIAALLGDREFVGQKWIDMLMTENISFALRLKENMYVQQEGYAPMTLHDKAGRLKHGETMKLPGKWQFGSGENPGGPSVKLSVKRLKNNELLAIATTMKPALAMETYRKRWTIETLFANLKSRGFNLEDTHMTDPERIETIFGVLAICTSLIYKTTGWVVRFKPIPTKKHGRPARSLFRAGIQTFRKALSVTDMRKIILFFQHLFEKQKPRNSLIRFAL